MYSACTLTPLVQGQAWVRGILEATDLWMYVRSLTSVKPGASQDLLRLMTTLKLLLPCSLPRSSTSQCRLPLYQLSAGSSRR